MAAWPSSKLSVSRSTARRAVRSSPMAKVARLVPGLVGEFIARFDSGLFAPSGFCSLAGNFLPSLGRHAFGPRLAAHAAQRHGGGVLAVLGGDVLDLACGDSGDHDGVADGVGRALLAFRA